MYKAKVSKAEGQWGFAVSTEGSSVVVDSDDSVAVLREDPCLSRAESER
jgi:hypothetical protein